MAGVVDWDLAAVFVADGVVGSLLGARGGWALHRTRGLLTRVFAGLILLVAACVLARSLGLCVAKNHTAWLPQARSAAS